jgi:hypothetical protein
MTTEDDSISDLDPATGSPPTLGVNRVSLTRSADAPLNHGDDPEYLSDKTQKGTLSPARD